MVVNIDTRNALDFSLRPSSDYGGFPIIKVGGCYQSSDDRAANGDVVFVRGFTRFQGRMAGKHIDLWTRETNGQWLLARDPSRRWSA